MRTTFPFKYQLIANTIEFFSNVPRKMCNWNACTAKETNFVKDTDWPSKLPDCSLLDYYFWDRVQEKVYDGRCCYPFATIDELKRRIRDVWNDCASDLPQIREAMKQFLPCLEAVDAKEGGSIKAVFG